MPGSGRQERFIPPRNYRLPKGVRASYRTINGKRYRTVSRRQYDNARASRQGFRSISMFRRTQRKNARYNFFFDVAASRRGDGGKIKNRGQFRRMSPEDIEAMAKLDSEFNRLYGAVDWGDTDPDGSQAEFLQWVGLRDPDSMAPVGSGGTGFGEFAR